VVTDADGPQLIATLTISDLTAGTLSTATVGTVTSTFSTTTGIWTPTGPLASVNTLLAGLTFVPTPDFNGSFSIATSMSDGMAGPITGTKAFTGIAVNDAPTATNVSAAETYTED